MVEVTYKILKLKVDMLVPLCLSLTLDDNLVHTLCVLFLSVDFNLDDQVKSPSHNKGINNGASPRHLE